MDGLAPPDPTPIRYAVVSRLARSGNGLLIAAAMAFLVLEPRAALANPTHRALPPLETSPLIAIEVFKPAIEPSGIALPAPIVRERKFSEPAIFKTLYVGYAAVQFGDIITTTTALHRGGREANPLIGDGASARLIGVKAATTVVTIVAIEKLRKRHPVAAKVTFAAVNAALAAVTINNVSAARRAKRVEP